MLSFIQKKWQIILFESENSGVPPYLLILKKILFSVFSFVWAISNLILFALISPLIFLCVLSCRLRQKKQNAFFIGLEHIIHKTTERSSLLQSKGLHTHFFSFENTGKRAKTSSPLRVTKYSASILWDQLIFCILLLKENPMYVEIYFEGNGMRQLISTAMARSANSLCISIERGAFSNALENTLSSSYAFMLVNTMRISHKVFYREPYMLDFLGRYGLSDKSFFDYNKVAIAKEEEVVTEKSPYEFLFLNGFAKMRRIDLVVEAFRIVQEMTSHKLPLHLTLVGYRNEVEKQYAEKLIEKSALSNSITLAGWTENSKEYFQKASVFLLPADLVFCNFSLLEAMEKCCIPIVADVRDSDRIITDGVDGFIAPQDASAIAEKLAYLIQHPEIRRNMAKAAREKIKSTFDSQYRMQPIISLLSEKFHYYNPN